MNLPEFLTTRKEWGRVIYLILLIFLVGIGSFFLGRLSNATSSQKELRVVGGSVSASAILSGSTGAIAGGVVASKTGTKYHFPWCAGAQAIGEENKIWFASTEGARKAGYTPAGNCKGLE